MFPKLRVLVVFLDDLRAEPGQVYRTVLDHLDLEDDGRADFPVVNRRRNVRWPWLQALLRDPPEVTRPAVRFARRIYLSSESLRSSWQQLRDDGGPDETGLIALRRELSIVFEPEIRKLEDATGRDLDSWRFRS